MHGSTGLMRVPETLPPFTLRLSEAFVNGKQRISTGFLRVLSVFLEFLVDFAVFSVFANIFLTTNTSWLDRFCIGYDPRFRCVRLSRYTDSSNKNQSRIMSSTSIISTNCFLKNRRKRCA